MREQNTPQTGPKRGISTAALSSMESGRSLIESLSHAPAHVCKTPLSTLKTDRSLGHWTWILCSRSYFETCCGAEFPWVRSELPGCWCAQFVCREGVCQASEPLRNWYFVFAAGTEPPRSCRGTGELRSNTGFQPIHY